MPYKDPEAQRAYYRAKWADGTSHQARRRVVLQERLVKAKSEPCVDCGGTFPPECMDFDHVRGDKLFNVAQAVWSGIGDSRFDAEVAKCELVCANCHRIRTRKRRNRQMLD